MSGNSLFYIVFIGQIFLMSYYFPRKMLERMKCVVATYPPSEYPLLYPRPVEYYQKGQWMFELVYRGIFLLGVVILLLIMFVVDHANFADDGFISEIWPAVYGIIQFVPLMMLEFTEFSGFKQMRKANVSTTRKASLQPRHLVDFVAPWIIGLAIFLFLASITFDFYVHQFIFDWGHDTVQRTIVLIGTNACLAGLGIWHLRGRKLDPHQAAGDRTNQISANLKSLFFVSAAMSVYFMTAAADDVYDLDFLSASLLSLYFQAIAWLSIGQMLRSVRLEDIDFEVYKKDASTT